MKYNQFRKSIGSPVFSLQDIRLAGIKVFNYQLTLWQKQGYIIKLKNGLYVFSDSMDSVMPEETAAMLYSPSYISLEKALSFYGLIPEMVYAITSVTPKTTRVFSNKLGHFRFRHIKPVLFFGYKQKQGKNRSFFMAEAEKALLDQIYFNRIKDKKDIESIRINWGQLRKTAVKSRLIKYSKIYNDRKIDSAVKIILGEL